MKKFTKIIIITLIAILTLTFNSNVYAASDGKITIDNAVSGETYKIYKMFELESFDKTTGAYAYKIVDAWRPFFATTGAGNGYVTIDEDGYITANALTDSTVEAFAKLALNYAKTQPVAATSTTTASSTTVEFASLDLGYYLVDTTLGTLCTLDTTDKEKTVKEKNTIPAVDNTAKEATVFGNANDAKIGDTINYKATINAYKGAENYELHGKLDSGLTIDTSTIVVTELGATAANNKVLTPGTDYTLVTTELSDDETFEIVFTDTYLNSVTGTSTAPTQIEVTYSATLNEDAVIGGNGNASSTYLIYGENNEKSATDVAKTYTWSTEYYKFYMDNTTKTPLANAIFVLSTTNASTGAISLVAIDDNVYRVAKTGETGTTTITTDATGEFEIQGLDSGTYYLIETTAPSGYNKLTSPITVVVESTQTGTTNGMTAVTKVDNDTVSTVEIENKTGTILPATGGIGTKLFITIGLILFVSTGVILVTKKRMYNAG